MAKLWIPAALVLAAVTAGCASIGYPLPSCDGTERRPLNAAKWTYERRADLGGTIKQCGRV
jgi:hypothetical protein